MKMLIDVEGGISREGYRGMQKDTEESCWRVCHGPYRGGVSLGFVIYFVVFLTVESQCSRDITEGMSRYSRRVCRMCRRTDIEDDLLIADGDGWGY